MLLPPRIKLTTSPKQHKVITKSHWEAWLHKLRATLAVSFLWAVGCGEGGRRSNREQKKARVTCFMETGSQSKKRSWHDHYPQGRVSDTLNTTHSVLPEPGGDPHPESSGSGVRVSASPFSSTWLSEAQGDPLPYLSPVCAIPQTLNTYHKCGTMLLSISGLFQ